MPDYDVTSGQVSSGIILNEGSTMYVSSGGTANSTTVNTLGLMVVSSGGTADNTTVCGDSFYYEDYDSCGSLCLAGGTLNNTAVNYGGVLNIDDAGGIIDSTTVNSGGCLIFEYYWGDGNKNLAVTNTTVNSGGYVLISGSIYDSDYVPVDNTTINSGGSMVICGYGGVNIDNTTINSGGVLVLSAGMASNTMVNYGGKLAVIETWNQGRLAGSASIVFNPWGGEVLELGGKATYLERDAKIYCGNLESGLVSKYDNATGLTVGGGLSAIVYSEGLAENAAVNSGGELHISSGGTASITTVSADGCLFVSSGGTAASADINGGTMICFCGGFAEQVSLHDGGHLYVSDGLVRDAEVLDGGRLVVYSAGSAEDSVVGKNGILLTEEFGRMSGITVAAGGAAYVMNLGEAQNIEVQTDGALWIGMAGYAENLTVGGAVYVATGGEVANVSIASSGTLYLYGGAILDGAINVTGTLVLDDAMQNAGGRIAFDISSRSAESAAMLNDLSLVKGSSSYSVNVSGSQDSGSYALAGGASGFTGTVSVCSGADCLGEVAVNGDALEYEGYSYALTNADGDLILSVSDRAVVTVETVVGEFATAQYGDELSIYSDGFFTLMSFQDKTVQSIGSLDSVTWKVVDFFDFDGDGLLELAVENLTTGNVYVADDLAGGISEEKLLNGTCLGLLADGYSFFGAGNFDGKAGDNDILLKGPAFGDPSVSLNYGLPVWSFDGGVKQYDGWLGALVNTWQDGDPLNGTVTDIEDVNAKNYRYEVVGIGDFNGDGRDDLMLQNTMSSIVESTPITGAGDMFVFLTGDETAVQTGAAPTVSYAGKVDAVDLNGWSVAGTGNFNNDGTDDVLLLNQSDGGLACWIMNNGQMQESTWIGIKPGDREIAGIWDVNADGTDDVVLSTGTGYEAWTINNGVYSGTQILA